MNRLKLDRPLNIKIVLKGETIFEKVFEEYPIILGRSSKCDIPLTKVDFLSRQHFSVTMEHSKILVVDLQSANGIYVGKQKVTQAEIKENLEVLISDLHVHFGFETPRHVSPSQQKTVIERASFKEKTRPKVTILTQPETIDQPIAARAPEECPVVVQKEKFSLPTKSGIDTSKPQKISGRTAKVVAKPTTQTEKSKSTPVSKRKVVSAVAGGVKPHMQAQQLRPQQRVLESSVTWKDQIYDIVQYSSGQQIVLGSHDEADLQVPILKKQMTIAKFDGINTQLFIPNGLHFELHNENKKIDFEELLESSLVSKKARHAELKIGAGDVVSIQLTRDVAVHFRYIPTPRALSRNTELLSDTELKEKTFIAGAIHFVLFLAIILTEPKSKAPHIKNVPDRYARLLVKPPEPKKEPPKPKPEEKKVAEKKPKPKKIAEKKPKIHKIVRLQKSKVLAKVNKWPVEVAKPLKPADKPVVKNIQAVGALAALNAFSSKAPSNVPVAININKNAGGQTALNTGGVIGALKTASGRLSAGGLASVKTKGLGYGTGTGYGVQGIQGTAGGRSIAGTVVGQPALLHFSKTEGLTREQVMSVVRQHMSEIQQCYERSLIDNPKLSGRVEYEWEISAAGRVRTARVKKSDVSSGDNLNNCVVGIFKEMRFPVAKNGQTTTPNIGFPFGRL